MTPKLLKGFMTLADMGNFGRAAAQLHLTQPALSRQIRLLEDELGVSLFDRHGRGVTLTAAGFVLRGRAAVLLREIEEIRQSLAVNDRDPTGEISVGLPAPLRSLVSCALVGEICDGFPRLKLRIFEGTPIQIRDLLNDGKLDVGVLSADERGSGLARAPLVTERLFLAGPPGSPFADLACFDVDRLVDYPLVQANPQNGVTMILTRYFAKSQRSIDLRIEASSYQLMVAIAATGRCYTVLPYSALSDAIRAGDLVAVPLSRLQMHWAIARRADRRLSVGMRAVVAALREICERRISEGAWATAVLEPLEDEVRP